MAPKQNKIKRKHLIDYLSPEFVCLGPHPDIFRVYSGMIPKWFLAVFMIQYVVRDLIKSQMQGTHIICCTLSGQCHLNLKLPFIQHLESS